jgi:hypothetical protein
MSEVELLEDAAVILDYRSGLKAQLCWTFRVGFG